MTTAQTSIRKPMRTINLLAASVIALGAGLGATPASAQNFNPFAALFGGNSQVQEGRSAYVPAPLPRSMDQGSYAQSRKQPTELRGLWDPSDPRLKTEMAKQKAAAAAKAKHDKAKIAAVTGKEKAAAPALELRGSIAYFAGDKTLRAGDIVVTNNGFMVFQGSNGARHSSSDFASLKSVAGDKGRSTLLALENASRHSTVGAWARGTDINAANTPAAVTEVKEPVKTSSLMLQQTSVNATQIRMSDASGVTRAQMWLPSRASELKWAGSL